ncbi:MAG: Trm112 family protein [Pirellulales bacterium]
MTDHSTLSEKTLAILRCPNDRSEVCLADAALVSRLNSAIDAGRLRNRSGKSVERPIDGALIRSAGDLVYPIVDHIPVMLYDEAIPLAQLEST